ncbi:DUF541 domain-containing protein [Agromyces intestinalis]|uniref:DUF541 domain-containing protein n=1 Tax=Agromyces intestinalis TaxID=2592652 RepID=A0A5C1YJC8_9MICO|nr:SIMPL domain-containing protein [Agromyces intestinalis]QEO15645.1 DUF541 domain-containing protein [Agromyces intestinalis]
MTTIIAVTGRADERVAPELAAVAVTVAVSGPDAERSLRDVADAHTRLLGGIRELEAAGSLERWSAGQVQTWSHRPWNADGRQLPPVFDARTRVEVVFRDLAVLAAWAGGLGADDLVRIEGIDWRLTDATGRRVREQAQRRAVADAVAKARVYAESLGLGTPVPVELADSGLLAPRDVPRPAPLFARAVAMDAGSPAPELAPGDLVIEASVDARFSAEPA